MSNIEYLQPSQPSRSYDEIIAPEDQVPFKQNNPNPRIPCILAVDTSGSMGYNDRIGSVNRMIDNLKKALLDDPMAKNRVELCVVEFNSRASVIQDFCLPSEWKPSRLQANGTTSLGAALDMSIDLLENRKALYRESATPYYRPWLIVLTDGRATDSLDQVRERIRNYSHGKKLVLLLFGMGDDNEMIRDLQSISDIPIPLDESKWPQLQAYLLENFQSISNSQPIDNVGPTTPTDVVHQSSIEKFMTRFQQTNRP